MRVTLLPSVLFRLLLVALPVGSAVAETSSAVARVRREQQLVLAESPVVGALEVRVARGVATLLRFDAEVARVEPAGEDVERGVWVEVARHAVVLEPLRELGPGERLALEVRFAPGTVPSRLEVQLLMHPEEVDARVDVELRPRRARPLGEVEAAGPRREEGVLAGFVLSGVMGKTGVTVTMFRGKTVGTGVIAGSPLEYRAVSRRAIAFEVRNPAGAKPWSAGEVVPLSAPTGSGRWKVHLEAPIEPGGSGWVVLEGALEGAGAPLLLEVREKGGNRVVRLEGQ